MSRCFIARNHDIVSYAIDHKLTPWPEVARLRREIAATRHEDDTMAMQGLMKGSKKMHKTAMVGKKHGTPMTKGGAHQKPPMPVKVNPERKKTAKSGKLTAM
jgi:hypothetical protein